MIGVFDSGLGGLTVLQKLIKDLPEYDYLYFGDNARAPYGDKSQDDIFNHTYQVVDFMFGKGCELIILACNTASSKALRRLQQDCLEKRWPGKKILGVVVPAIEEAVEIMKLKKLDKLGVIGTKSTIESGVYFQELRKISIDIKVFEKACPLFVPLVEKGKTDSRESKEAVRKHLSGLKEKNIQALILACTHYPFLIKQINEFFNGKVEIINTSVSVSHKTKDYLKRHPEIDKKLGKNKKRCFYTSGKRIVFDCFASEFLKTRVRSVKKKF